MSPGIFTLLRARTPVRSLAFLAAEILDIAIEVGAVDVTITRLAAVPTVRDDHLIFGAIHRHGDSLIEDIAATIEALSLHLRIFPVAHDPAMQLAHIRKPFLDQKAGELLAANAASAVGEDRFVFMLAQILAHPLRKLLKGLHIGTDRIAEVAEVILVVVPRIDHNDILLLQRAMELF